MLKSPLLTFFGFLTTLRGWIAHLNGMLPWPLTQTQLYCLLFGITGLGLYFLVRPIIGHLARRGNESVISWAYALTLLVSLLFLVEIGRLATDSTSISPDELLSAIGGFLSLFFAYLLISGAVHIFKKLARKCKKR